MGLDSIELLMEIENYFGISIPDAEAEKLYTVQLMVDSVAQHLKISNENFEMKDKIFLRVTAIMKEFGWLVKNITPADFIGQYFPSTYKQDWKSFEDALRLSIPQPYFSSQNPTLLESIIGKPLYKSDEISFEQFVAAICANNYQVLIDKNHINSKYEIYIAVMGITVDKLGVDYYEVRPDKSFTSDLGVD